jgi:hypothetical protein
VIKILLIENKVTKNSAKNILQGFTLENDIELKVFEDENGLIDFFDDGSDEYFSNFIVIFNLSQLSESVFSVIERIKGDLRLKHIPLFVIADVSDYENVVRSYMCHVNCYIIKPEDLEGLIGILNSFKDLWLKHVRLP